ncbi:Kinesin-like protein KIF15 [Strongyloides ratti]|uniref:Kinesin-like protein KIF15 n=1 Tax=Strongyloides ratti TaxID=34506 RepID=A0A090LEX3_STRRB|nr:Kinesin-like protein KIF15 [Strongyloides ratti]CEF68302.1 Kinesin-like protein KIF15 [Strongyloides ratti]
MATSEKLIVSCRIRPSLINSGNDNQSIAVDSLNNTVSIYDSDSEHTKYTFDNVFDRNSTQVEIFEKLGKRIVDGCITGVNGTIFVYGQTGSGKTWTMLGPIDGKENNIENQGLIQRSINYLLLKLEKIKTSRCSVSFAINAQCIQLYKETLYDLQTPHLQKITLKTRPQGIVVEGATNTFINTSSDLQKMLKEAWTNRIVSETSINAESSRSHAIFTFDIEIKETIEDAVYVRKSCLNLVDLAGSERINMSSIDTERIPETAAINKSLLQLGRVIRSLSTSNNSYVAYRDSLLTQLLRDSLGGNARTAVIVNCHPDRRFKEESISTLNFAMNCMKVINKARVNEDLRAKNVDVYKNLLSKSKEELYLLTKEFEKLQEKKDISNKEFDAIRAENNSLEKQLLKKNEDLEKLHGQFVKLEEEHAKDVMEYKISITDLKTQLSELINISRSRQPSDSKKNRRRAIHVPTNLNKLVEETKLNIDKDQEQMNLTFASSAQQSSEIEMLKVEKLRLEVEINNLSNTIRNKESIIEKYENLENEKIQQYMSKVIDLEMVIDELREKLHSSEVRESRNEVEIESLRKIVDDNSVTLKESLENVELLQSKLLTAEQNCDDLKQQIAAKDIELENALYEIDNLKLFNKKELKEKLEEQKAKLCEEFNNDDVIEEVKKNYAIITEELKSKVAESDKINADLRNALSQVTQQLNEQNVTNKNLIEKENILLKQEIEAVTTQNDELFVKIKELEDLNKLETNKMAKQYEEINQALLKTKKEKESLEMQIRSMVESVLNQCFSPNDFRMSVLSSFNSSSSIYDAVVSKVKEMKDQLLNDKCQREFTEEILKRAQEERDEWEEKYLKLEDEFKKLNEKEDISEEIKFTSPVKKVGTKKSEPRKKVLKEQEQPSITESVRRSTRKKKTTC